MLASEPRISGVNGWRCYRWSCLFWDYVALVLSDWRLRHVLRRLTPSELSSLGGAIQRRGRSCSTGDHLLHIIVVPGSHEVLMFHCFVSVLVFPAKLFFLQP